LGSPVTLNKCCKLYIALSSSTTIVLSLLFSFWLEPRLEAELPEHTFFYRDMDKSEGVIGKV